MHLLSVLYRFVWACIGIGQFVNTVNGSHTSLCNTFCCDHGVWVNRKSSAGRPLGTPHVARSEARPGKIAGRSKQKVKSKMLGGSPSKIRGTC